ncbi:VCBS repeat-containing protein [Bradyrhizobium jicamae]|uniref:FG-GAP repeat domain-containing protein n=1 Tax=Bradyrhizobium jicamae TaxID=280332 RepID=UPI001BAE1F3B|nr:VCBS repeat-containing protein [Bradyrhizobium jicamae]MBR0757377.1 VCBS repeat-containing protein [Bradyrhizobium jicamae]
MSNFTFRTIDVPDAAGTYTYIGVTGVDAAGEAVGYYGSSDGDGDSTFHGFTTSEPNVGVTFDPTGSSNTNGMYITAGGEIYGDYVDYANRQHGFIDANGTVSKFDFVPNQYTILSGLDDAGNMFGDYFNGTSVEGFVDINGTFSVIDVAGSQATSVAGINVATGEIVGTYSDQSYVQHAFVIKNGVTTTFNAPNAYSTTVVAVSSNGTIVGDFQDLSNHQHGFIDASGTPVAFDVAGAVDTSITGINASGEIVGNYTDGTGVHGFTDIGGTVTTVDVPNAIDTNILGVNDAGDIFGYYNDASGQHGFVGAPTAPPPPPPPVAAPLDFNGDGMSDLLFQNNTTHGVAVWELNGTQVIANPQVAIAPSGAQLAGTGDFNDDGKTDLLFVNDSTHDVTVWDMNGTQIANSATVGTINAAGGWQFADTGDFNGDHKTDLLFTNSSTNGVAVWQMDGAHMTQDGQVAIMPSGFHFAATGDFNGDGKTDLLTINDTTHQAAVMLMNGTQATSQTTIGTINAAGGWQFEGTGDFNGDGKTDLLFLNSTTHGVAIWEMNGTQVTANPQIGIMNAASGWHFADVGDFNGDGKSDLLFLNDTTGGVAVWQMNGTQVTANPQIGIMDAGFHYVGQGDYNGDGKSDLLFENDTTHAVSAWELNGTQIEHAAQVGAINAAGDWHLIG